MWMTKDIDGVVPVLAALRGRNCQHMSKMKNDAVVRGVVIHHSASLRMRKAHQTSAITPGPTKRSSGPH